MPSRATRPSFRNRIVALIRFSYPGRSGFGPDPADPAVRARMLYDPARLDARFRLFEGLTLPSLRAQTDGDFRACVIIGRDMPRAWHDRLADALRSLPGAMIVALPPLTQAEAVTRALHRAVGTDATHRTGFRLDDDDALALDVVARLRRTTAALASAQDHPLPFVTGFNRGLFVTLGDGPPRVAEVIERLPLGIGLAMTTPVDHSDHVFRRNHRMMPQFFSIHTDADRIAFLRTVHPGNDSAALPSGQHTPLADAEAETRLTAHFPFGLDRLGRL